MEYNKVAGELVEYGVVVWKAPKPVIRATRRVRKNGCTGEDEICYIMVMDGQIDFIFEKDKSIVSRQDWGEGWFAPLSPLFS